MSALTTNQFQMRPKIFSGSPKKNAACWSFSNTNGGINPGFVSTCQRMKIVSSRLSCQNRRYFMDDAGSSCRELLPVALEHLVAQHRPDGAMQLDEARRDPHLGHVARARQVDRELA